jgi:excisionase family DNA binding protein
MKQTMTVSEAAERLGISKASAYKYAREGNIPGVVRLGKRLLIARERFDEMFDNEPSKNQKAAAK